MASADIDTQANATTSKVEILAKLYLKGDPAEISDATIAELCGWLWGEFQSAPQNSQSSWDARYDTVVEMFADIKKSHLWVAKNYDPTLGPNPIRNFISQMMHDNDYTHKDFSLVEEIAAYNAAAKSAPSLTVQKIIYSEGVLRSAAQLFLGYAPIAKIVFP